MHFKNKVKVGFSESFFFFLILLGPSTVSAQSRLPTNTGVNNDEETHDYILTTNQGVKYILP